MNIPQTTPLRGYLAAKTAIDQAIRRVLSRGQYILGPEVTAFEREFAAYVGVRFGVGVASGTDALAIALRAIGIRAGDEVITASHTATATVSAIVSTGAAPILVDIEDGLFTLDLEQARKAITRRTRAIVPVHLYGCPVNMDAVCGLARQHGLRIVEDCAQAHGAAVLTRRRRTCGSIGDAGCFSFYPTKNLGAFGDGGMIVTDDAQVAERCRRLREYGWKDRYVSSVHGVNSRLDELQAAILRVKLRRLERDNERRRDLAALYEGLLMDLPVQCPRTPSWADPVFHQFVIRVPQRDLIRSSLASKGVGTAVHYPVPVHLQPGYRRLVRAMAMPRTEQACREIISLPMFPQLSQREVRSVVRTLKAMIS